MPDPNPSERLAEIEARVEAVSAASQWYERISAKGRFEAEAYEDIPWLLERVKELREALAAYRSALRSGEPETQRLREFGDAALADSGETSGEAG